MGGSSLYGQKRKKNKINHFSREEFLSCLLKIGKEKKKKKKKKARREKYKKNPAC
jgi:hypothetical protein